MSHKEKLLHEFTEDVCALLVKFKKLGLSADDLIFVMSFIICDRLTPKCGDKEEVDVIFHSKIGGG